MKAVLRKIQLNPSDKLDTVQFQTDSDNSEILEYRRDTRFRASAVSRQSSISEDGELIFEPVEFSVDSVSISICCTDSKQITTVTFSLATKKDTEDIIRSGLKGMAVDLHLI